MKRTLVVGLGVLAAVSAYADFYFKATDGRNDWGYTNSWYTDSGRTTPSPKLPDNSSNIYIPAGEDVLATNVDTRTVNLFVGSTAGGVGKLTLGTGTKLWPGYNSYYIGNVAGSTGVLHIAIGRADVNDEGLVTTPTLTPVADAVYNIGEFAVVQHLKGGLTVSLQ